MACIPVYKGKKFSSTKKLIEFLSTEEGIMAHLADGKDAEFTKAVEDAVGIADKTLGEKAPKAGSVVGGEVDFTAKGGNKVVDEKGEPITVYHTTKAKNITEFKTSGEIETLGGKVKNEGAYFTPIKGEYANKGGNEYAVQISIKNPYITTDQIESAIISPEKKADLISKGHDGVILMRNGKPAEYVVFDKSQIKAVEQSLKETPKPKAEKTSPLAPFQTKDKEGQAARAALKESVGPKEYKRLENIAKNGEKILKDLQAKNVLKIDCP